MISFYDFKRAVYGAGLRRERLLRGYCSIECYDESDHGEYTAIFDDDGIVFNFATNVLKGPVGSFIRYCSTYESLINAIEKYMEVVYDSVSSD